LIIDLRFHLSVFETPDPFWDAYLQTGDADRLGRSWAMVMRAANGPNFVAALYPGKGTDSFLEALTDRLAARIAADPQRSLSYMVIVAMEKVA
jgi:hypothetical protein